MRTVLVTAPAAEPVLWADAQAHLRLSTTDDQSTVERQLKAARQWVERILWRGLINQQWDLYLDSFLCGSNNVVIELPKGKLQTLDSIVYVDADGDSQTLSADDYQVDSTSEDAGRVAPSYDAATWPVTRSRTFNAVRIRYTVGYGTTGTSVPEPIRAAILLVASHLYLHRQPEVTGTIATELNFQVMDLLSPYRLRKF